MTTKPGKEGFIVGGERVPVNGQGGLAGCIIGTGDNAITGLFLVGFLVLAGSIIFFGCKGRLDIIVTWLLPSLIWGLGFLCGIYVTSRKK